ncbi:MAG: GtrA family protein [Halioglobus sp.]
MQEQPTVKQLRSFAAVGIVGTAVHYLVLVALVSSGSAHPVPASALAFTGGAVVNYTLNYRFTFASRKRHVEAASKFYVVALVGLLINSAIMALGVNTLDWHYLLTQLLATGIVFIWNFAGNKVWTFRETRRGTSGQ